jgi:membrane associated rhomboid family serine protease
LPGVRENTVNDSSDFSEAQPWGEPHQGREPAFNAPIVVIVLCVGLIGLYTGQSLTMSQYTVERLALTAAGLADGRWQTLFTSMFLHGSWMHVLTNSVAALAFGPPVARLFGETGRGAATFVAFYLVCGVIAGLGFVATDFGDASPVVGASGAISGLIGAAARIIEGRGRVGPLFGRTVIGMTITWSLANVILGVSGLTPGAMGMPVAWQAHLFGYAAGLLLIGPFARLAGRNGTVFTQ